MVSFMSGMPRVRVDQGRVNKYSFIEGFANRHFENKDAAALKEKEDKQFTLDQQKVDNEKAALDLQTQNLALALSRYTQKSAHDASMLNVAKGITELPNFFYKGLDGKDKKYTYKRPKANQTGANAVLTGKDHRDIILQANEFLDPNQDPKLLKNKLRAIDASVSFKNHILNSLDGMSTSEIETDNNTGLSVRTSYAPIISSVKGYSNKNDFLNLLNAFPHLSERGMSLEEYMINLQDGAFSDAGVNLRNQDHEEINFIINNEGKAVIYNKTKGEVEIPEGSRNAVQGMFVKNLSQEEFEKKMLVFEMMNKVSKDKNATKIGSVIVSDKAKQHVNIGDITASTGPQSEQMKELAVFAQDIVDVIIPVDKNTNRIRNTGQTETTVKGIISGYLVENASKFGSIIEKGNKLYFKPSPQYANNIIDLQENKTLQRTINGTITISKEGVREITSLFNIGDDIDSYIDEAVKRGEITPEEANKYREFKFGEAVTESLFTGLFQFKEITKGLADVLTGTLLANNTRLNNDMDTFERVLGEGGTAIDPKNQKLLLRASSEYSRRMDKLTEAKKDGDINEYIFNQRATAEGIKVRLAFKLASIVQGGGTGGRTISNQDYEVIVKSLFGFGTNASLVESLAYVRNTLFKKQVTSQVFKDFALTGMQDELVSIAGNYIDADYNLRTDSQLTGWRENKPVAQMFEELNSSMDIKNRMQVENNLLGTNPNTLTPVINSLGNSTHKNFIGLGTNTTELLTNNLFTSDDPFKSKKLKTDRFKPLLTSVLLPHLLINMNNENVSINDNNVKGSLETLGFTDKLAEGVIIDFKEMSRIDNLSEINNKNKEIHNTMIANLQSSIDDPDTPLSEELKSILNNVITELNSLDIGSGVSPTAGGMGSAGSATSAGSVPAEITTNEITYDNIGTKKVGRKLEVDNKGPITITRNNASLEDLDTVLTQTRFKVNVPDNIATIKEAFKRGYSDYNEYYEKITQDIDYQDPKSVQLLQPDRKATNEEMSSAIFNLIQQIIKGTN